MFNCVNPLQMSGQNAHSNRHLQSRSQDPPRLNALLLCVFLCSQKINFLFYPSFTFPFPPCKGIRLADQLPHRVTAREILPSPPLLAWSLKVFLGKIRRITFETHPPKIPHALNNWAKSNLSNVGYLNLFCFFCLPLLVAL